MNSVTEKFRTIESITPSDDEFVEYVLSHNVKDVEDYFSVSYYYITLYANSRNLHINKSKEQIDAIKKRTIIKKYGSVEKASKEFHKRASDNFNEKHYKIVDSALNLGSDVSYSDFIDGIIKSRGRFGTLPGAYKERHHIVPKCLGGKNNEDNLVDLYPSEHYTAHKLLAIENRGNMSLVRAWMFMCLGTSTSIRERVASPEEYEEMKKLFSESETKESSRAKMSITKRERYASGDTVPWNKGLTKHTDERVKKLSERLKDFAKSRNYWGENNPNYGNHKGISGENNPMRTEEARRKVSEAKKLNNPMCNPEIAKKVSEKLKGRPARNREPVICIETGEEFESISSASQKYGSKVSIACKNRKRTAGGYHWIKKHSAVLEVEDEQENG